MRSGQATLAVTLALTSCANLGGEVSHCEQLDAQPGSVDWSDSDPREPIFAETRAMVQVDRLVAHDDGIPPDRGRLVGTVTAVHWQDVPDGLDTLEEGAVLRVSLLRWRPEQPPPGSLDQPLLVGLGTWPPWGFEDAAAWTPTEFIAMDGTMLWPRHVCLQFEQIVAEQGGFDPEQVAERARAERIHREGLRP